MRIDHRARCPDCPTMHQLCSADPKLCVLRPCLAHVHFTTVVRNGTSIVLSELKVARVQHFCDSTPKGRPEKLPGLSRHMPWPVTNATPALVSRHDMLSARILFISTILSLETMAQVQIWTYRTHRGENPALVQKNALPIRQFWAYTGEFHVV